MNGIVVGTAVSNLRKATSSVSEKKPVPNTGPRLRLQNNHIYPVYVNQTSITTELTIMLYLDD